MEAENLKKKILTVQFRHETNTFAPKPADMQAFRCNRFFVGEEVFPNVRKMHIRDVQNDKIAFWVFFQRMRPEKIGVALNINITACLDLFDTREDVELVPTVALYATPCGPVTEEVYDFVTRQILTVIRKEGPFAGVFLDIHGAMVAEGHPDGEGDLMELQRRELGWEIPIVASLDLHANVTEKMARCASALFPYNTYPHVDMYETGMAAAKLLEKTLDGKMQPAMAYRRIPFLQPLLSHESEALRPLYELAEKLSQTPGVVSVRFAHGFFPADIEEMGMSVMVITEGNASLTEKTADTLADAIRERIPLLTAEYMDLDSALDIALREEGTVTLADASDNPGAGGMGDTTHILKRLLERGITGAAIAIILDPKV